MISASSAYITWLEALGFKQISFGSGGLHLEPVDALPKLQIGYAVALDGSSLCTGESGAWQREWLAIGYDTSVGDPLILDLSGQPMRVLTAMHGVGSWDPICVASSLEGFRVALHEIRELSRGRENPVLLGRNPLPASEQSAALKRIGAANPGVDLFYWKLQMQDFQ
jgi:hypothetical protein